MSDEDRPRGVKPSTSQELNESNEITDESSSGQSDAKKVKRITQAEKEDLMLPNLKPVPGEWFYIFLFLFL